MKRMLLTSLLFIVLIGASLAQTMTIHISGHVYNIANQAPIPNHQVFIFADSTSPPYFSYYNMVTTNANGFYEVMVNLTTTSLVMFHVQTYDCNNILHSAQATTANTQLIFNFNICATTPPPCSANFTFAPCLNGANCFHFIASPINSTTQYLWTFDDGTGVATTADPHHTFAQAGVYEVCLRIWTASGCQDSVCQSITVNNPTPPCTATFVAIQDSVNSNLYHFVATATGGPTSFQWGFGDGTSGTGPYVNHIYAGSGYYVVCLHVNGANCQVVVCDTIIVTGTPPPCSAGFAFAPCQNSLNCFHFEANAQNSTTQYLWTFDDGTGIDTTADPHHTFTQPGNYLVCLRIWTASGCQDSVCQSITVGNPPPPCTATFVAIQDSVNSSLYHFVATASGNATSFQWGFGDGTSGSGMYTSHNYTVTGYYVVCLHVSGVNCQTIVCDSIYINVPIVPCQAGFTPIPSTSNPLGYYFQGTSTGSNQYYSHWNFGDGTSGTGTNAYHLYSQPGTYTVCLLITNTASNCFDSICATITVGNTPPPCSAGFAFAPCSNSLNCFHFEANAQNSTTQYLWTFDDGTGIDTTANPHHTFTQPGVYLVCLRIWTASGCQDSVCQSVTIGNPPPPCTATFVAIQDSVNSNLYHFIATATGNPTSFYWGFGDGTSGTGPYVNHIYAGSGYYVVCLHVNGTNCQTVVCDTVIVNITPLPCVANFITNVSPGNPFEYHFQNTSTGSNQFTSYWHFGDGAVGTGFNGNHVYAQGGTYIVCLYIVNTATNCYDSICYNITVTNTPPPCSAGFAFAPCQNSLNCFHFEANYQNSTTQYLWTFDDGTGIDTTADPYHTFTQPGVYLVCLRIWTASGCQDSVCQSVTVGATPFYEIWGHVYAGSNILLDHGKARLFKVNNGINAAQLMAISTIDSNGTYHFNNIPAGTYYVKAKATPNSQFFGQYLPTYYPHNVHWINATPIIIPPTNNPYDINLKHVISPFGGPGMIGGSITEGYKLSESGPPAPDIDILLKPLTGDPYIYVESDINGAFNFDNLGYDTYEIYPEVTGLTTVPAIITLNANNPAANNVNLVITPNQVAAFISDNGDNTNFFDIYPNPATTEIKVEVSLAIAGEAVLSIYDLPGRLVFSERPSLPKGIHKLNYDLSAYENGSYIMQLKTSQGLLSRKFIVVK